MAQQVIKLRRSSVPGKIPDTGSLDFGEIALNTNDGIAYMKKSGSGGEQVVAIGTGTSGSFTGSFFGTASWANNAISSSYALSASLSQTSSYSFNSVSASYSLSSSYAVSSSRSQNSETASYVLNAISSSYAATASSADNFLVRGTLTAQTIVVQTITSSIDFVTGSTRFGTLLTNTHQFTGSVNITGSLNVAGAGITGSLFGTSSFATTASFATTSSFSSTASFSFNASTASFATSASFATNASTASFSLRGSGSFSGSFTGSFVGDGSGITNISASSVVGLNLSRISSGSVTASVDPTYGFTVNSNSQISGALQVTGSVGITGSLSIAGNTGSVFYSNADVIVMTGSFYQSGSNYINGLLEVTGSLRSPSITGSLFGTASWANNATTSSHALSAVSASYAVSSSYAQNAGTSSNILGGNATYIPFFKTDTTLGNSTMYQISNSFSVTSIAINETNITSANPEALYVFQTHPTSINVLTGKGNLNNYLQNNIQNTNQGVSASSDVVATANNGNETTNYIDMGINSQNYSQGFIGDANDAYLYSIANNLHIGNANDNGTHVGFFVGGSDVEAFNKLQLSPNNQHKMSGSLDISGSLIVRDGITGSLYGTSSWSQNSLTASYAISATSSSYSISSSLSQNAITSSLALSSVSASYAESASQAQNSVSSSHSVTALSASYSVSSSQAQNAASSLSSSFSTVAITSSYADNFIVAGTLTAQTIVVQTITSSIDFVTGSTRFGTLLSNTHEFTGSVSITGSLTVVGDGITGSIFGTASWASNAISSSYSLSASQAQNAVTASYALNAVSSSYTLSASFATSASQALNSISSSYPIAVSGSTLYTRITAVGNIASNSSVLLGDLAGDLSPNANSSIFIGSQAGRFSTDAYGSQFIGTAAGAQATNARYSTFIGTNAGQYAIDARYSNFIGINAGYSAKFANYSNFLGNGAGEGAASASYSTLIGHNVGYNAGGPGINTNNIIIGTNITLPNNVRDSINIGGLIFGTGSYFNSGVYTGQSSGSANGRIGINQPLPIFSLDVSGSGRYTNGLQITGSLNAPIITGSLFGTASWANNAVSSSYVLSASQAQNAVSASYVLNAVSASYSITSSLPLRGIITASVTGSTITFTKGDNSTFSVLIATATSETASYVSSSNVDGPFGKNSILSASYAQTASFVINAVSSSFATTASYVVSSSYALSASQAQNSTTASYVLNAVSASYAQTASYAVNVTVSGSITDVDYIDFDTNASFAAAIGRLGYDSGEGTLTFGVAGGNVTLKIGSDLYQYVYNNTTSSMTLGQVVYVSGSQGNRIAVKLASATAEQGSANTLGFVAETIAAGAEGWVMTEGNLRKLNTLGLIGGGLIYLGVTPGTYTQTPPVAPNHGVRLGYAERIDNTVGSIYVKIDNGYELGELHDVVDSTTSSSYGDLLVRSGSVWINSKQLTGSYELTGSLNTTGSNNLVGTQTITGSLNVSGSQSFVGTSISVGNQIVTGSLITSGSNILVGNTTLTGSVSISGSTTQIGNNNLLGTTNLSGSVVVSGSLNASANVTLQGHLRLDPGQDPGNNNFTASYLFTSASNTTTGYDLYYRQDGNLIKFKWLEGGVSSGILYGGTISFSGSLIFVKKGTGIINNMNATTGSEINPIITYVTWNDYTASAQYLTSSQITYLYASSNGTINQQTSYFDQTQYEQAIPLGLVTHPNYTSITGYQSSVQTTYDSDTQQNDFVRAFGPIKVNGFTPSGQAGSLRLNIGTGTAFVLGGFYSQDQNSPSHYTATAESTASLARAYRSGSGIRIDDNNGAYYTVIDPTKYDTGTGLSNVAGTNASIQRIFYNPVSKQAVVYYGQNTYSSIANATTALPSDSFTEGEFTAKALIFVGYLIVQGNASDLTNTGQALFIQAGVFRNTAGGSSGGGAAAQSLDDLSDVTITTPTNGQALIYQGGTWINGIPLNASTASLATSASFAQSSATASYVLNSVSSSFATTASYAISASAAQDAATASYVLNAISSSFATTASYVLNAVSSSFSTFSITSSFANNFTVAGTLTAQTIVVQTITSSIDFVTGSTRFGTLLSNTHEFTGSVRITGSLSVTGAGITGSLFGTSSWANNATTASYALFSSQSINASTASSADNFIVRNDIGMTNASAGTIYNSVDTSRLNFGMLGAGLSSYNGGYFTVFGNNYSVSTQRGGAEFVFDTRNGGTAGFGIFSYDGSTWTKRMSVDVNGVGRFTSGLQVTGSLNAPVITGSLFGTASWANNAITASYVLNAVSASFATSASQAQNAVTASYILNAVSASYAVSASFATSASRAQNAVSSSYPIAISGSTIYTPFGVGNFSTTDGIFLGNSAGSGSDSANNSNFLGPNAGRNASNANNSNFLGTNAGRDASSAYGSNFLGNNTGWEATNASFSNFLGSATGYQATNAERSNFIGNIAGYAATNANYSNFLGEFVGYEAINANNSNFLGNSAGYQATNANYSNFLGYQTGWAAVSASYSTLIGYRVGYASGLTSIGPNNIIIGHNITLEGNRRDSINLGGLIFGTGSYSTIMSDPFSGSANGRIGINQPLPIFSLDVSGSGRYTDGLQVTGSLNAPIITGSLFGTASWASNAVSSSYALSASNAQTASYVLNAVSASFATTAVTASYADNFTVAGTLTAQTIVVQTITSSVDFVTGSTRFGTLLSNTHQFTGSVSITGSLNVAGAGITGSLFGTASWASNAITASNALTASFVQNAVSASFASTASNVLGGATNYIPLWNTATTLSSSVIYQNSGNVGIGTTTPTNKLEVAGGNVLLFPSDNTRQLSFYDTNYGITANNGLEIFTGDYIRFRKGGTEYARINNNGNVGIGTQTPNAKLDVNGNAIVSGSLTVTQGITGSLFGTSSWANNTTSASYTATSSYSNNFTVANQLTIDSTLTDYASVASSIVGSNNIFTQATGSYTSAFFKYTATTGSNSRAGEVVAVWNGTTVQYYDNSTVDIGNTTAVTSSVSIVGGDVQFNMQTNTSGWRIKSLATFM